MHELLAKILETAILLILWYNGTSEITKPGEFALTNFTGKPNLASQLSSIIIGILNKNKIADTTNHTVIGESKSLLERKSSDPRSYYSHAAPFIPAFDPISVLASLAFLAFLLQSFAALFDRTRSMIPTIVSSRQLQSDHNDQFQEIQNMVMRALEEYASISTSLLDNDNKNEKS